MKTVLLSIAAAALTLPLVAAPASAQGLSFSYGATLTSDYMSRGMTQSNHNVALQPWVEIGNGGWYAGLWMSNVEFGADRLEVDLSAGYRWTVNQTSLDIGYARYFYDDSGDASGELYILVEHEAGDMTLSTGAYLGHVGRLTWNEIHAGFAMPLVNNLSGSARIGITPGNNLYGDIGVTYDVNSTLAIDARYHDSTLDSGRLVLSTSISF